MTIRHISYTGEELELFAAADSAIRHIPPAFPLDATVAVNPYLGQTGESRATTAARLAKSAGARLTAPRTWFAENIASGALTDADLAAGGQTYGLTADQLKTAAQAPMPALAPLPTVAELAQDATGVDYPGLIEERIGLWAAGHFDEGQAFWPAPDRPAFAAWRAFASRDLSPGIAGVPGVTELATHLPDDSTLAFAELSQQLGLTPEDAELYYQRLLMTMGGWSQLARGKGWVAERDSGRDRSAFDLLTIRMAWDAALLAQHADAVAALWLTTRARYADPLQADDTLQVELALQDAADLAAERRLTERFSTPVDALHSDRPALQAAFCIDVRSEVLRRALETADGGMRTIGFAGFFGLAVTHHRSASDTSEARAPVLLSPGLDTKTTVSDTDDRAARMLQRTDRAWGRFKAAAVSAFAFVEAAGPLYAGKLVKAALAKPGALPTDSKPTADLPLADRIASAGTVLRAMSLTDQFAPLVLLAGHGAHVTNAPHASALQCGACGGHAGDVNARLLAGLLNDPHVRAALPKEEGITIPEDTVFLPGLHDTVSDEVTLFETDVDLSRHSGELARLKATLAKAGAMARNERAAVLPRAEDGAALALRGGDWSEVRPEWGLAGCNAFIAAPRALSSSQNLGGRSFLHSYDWQADEGFPVLELILTTPVVVASWIALQYHGSSTAPEIFGGGNKLLHNVTGGIGVLEGAGGNLMTGLPWQSVHDGDGLRHSPERLSVVIAAPTNAISDVLEKHPSVSALFDNGWLSLHAMDDQGQIAWRYSGAGTWVPAVSALQDMGAQSAA